MILEKLWPILISTLGIAFFCIGEAGSQHLIPLDPETDSTRDGLYYVDPRVMDTTWVRPDLNLAKYTGIMIMPSITSFREVFGSYHPRTASGTNGFRVSEINKNRLRDYFGEAFHEFASQLKPYEIADGVGRNVLLVQGFLIDVVSRIPPERRGSNRLLVRRPWEVTLMVELRDSMSNQLLARSVEKTGIRGSYDVTELPEVTQWATENWSQALLERLQDLMVIGGGRWANCDLRDRENNCAF
tara:strand:+ start:4107 stop:4835 length:729 start_codon:yes stop_codon:yes gene_type:complete